MAYGFRDEDHARRRRLAVEALCDGATSTDVGVRESAMHAMLVASDRRVLMTPEALRNNALAVEWGLNNAARIGESAVRKLEDSLTLLCLRAGLYGVGDGGAAVNVRAGLAAALPIVAAGSRGRDVLAALGCTLPTRGSMSPEEYRDALAGAALQLGITVRESVDGKEPEDALLDLRAFVRSAL